LKDYEIRSTQLRIGDRKQRGYYLESFHDAFSRYLPTPAPPVQSGTTVQHNNINELGVILSGTEKNSVPLKKRDNYLKSKECTIVPVEMPLQAGEEKNQVVRGEL
jgi:hypothetical protein